MNLARIAAVQLEVGNFSAGKIDRLGEDTVIQRQRNRHADQRQIEAAHDARAHDADTFGIDQAERFVVDTKPSNKRSADLTLRLPVACVCGVVG